MSKLSNLRIPGRYLLKLLVELVILCVAFFFASNIDEWLPKEWVFASTVKIILHFIIVSMGFSLLLRFLAIGYRRRKQLPFAKKDNVTVGLTNIFMMFIFIYALVSVLGLFGIQFKEMFTSLSIVAAAIAIISKDFVADIISGILISFSNEIKIGDHVKIGGQSGKVIDINISKTALLNDDDDIIFMPNNKVFGAETINYSTKPFKKTSIDFEVAKGEYTTIEEMEKVLIQLLSEFENDIESYSYDLRVVSIHKDYLVLKFQYQLNEFNRRLERSIRQKAVRYIVANISKKAD